MPDIHEEYRPDTPQDFNRQSPTLIESTSWRPLSPLSKVKVDFETTVNEIKIFSQRKSLWKDPDSRQLIATYRTHQGSNLTDAEEKKIHHIVESTIQSVHNSRVDDKADVCRMLIGRKVELAMMENQLNSCLALAEKMADNDLVLDGQNLLRTVVSGKRTPEELRQAVSVFLRKVDHADTRHQLKHYHGELQKLQPTVQPEVRSRIDQLLDDYQWQFAEQMVGDDPLRFTEYEGITFNADDMKEWITRAKQVVNELKYPSRPESPAG